MSRDLTKIETAKLLRRLKACDEARKWAKGMTLRRAWATCERGDWMGWLAGVLGVQMTPEALRALNEAMAAAERAYDEATAPALRALNEATAPAWRAYHEAMAAAWRAYDEATAPAWRVCHEAMAAAWRAAVPYEQIRDAARVFLGGGR